MHICKDRVANGSEIYSVKNILWAIEPQIHYSLKKCAMGMHCYELGF